MKLRNLSLFCFFFGLLLSFLLVCSHAEEVITLTDSNFSEITKEGKWIIDFYAPWCGYCKQLAPIFEEAAQKIKQQNWDVRLGKVDCTTETHLASKYHIKAFPTLKYFRYGVDTPYEGGRNVEDFVQFANKLAQPSYEELDDQQLEKKLEKVKSSHGSLFLFIHDSDDSKKDTFLRVAQIFHDSCQFAIISKQTASNILNLQDASFSLLRWSGNSQLIYSDPFEFENLKQWVNENRYSPFIQVDAEKFTSWTNMKKLNVIGVVDPLKEETTPYLNILIQASEKNSNFLFGYIDSQKYPKFLNAYSISSVPTFIVYDASKQVYYNMEGTEHENQPFSISSLTKFLEDVENGKIESKGSGKGILSFIQSNVFLISIVVVFICGIIVLVFMSSSFLEEEKKKDK